MYMINIRDGIDLARLITFLQCFTDDNDFLPFTLVFLKNVFYSGPFGRLHFTYILHASFFPAGVIWYFGILADSPEPVILLTQF